MGYFLWLYQQIIAKIDLLLAFIRFTKILRNGCKKQYLLGNKELKEVIKFIRLVIITHIY